MSKRFLQIDVNIVKHQSEEDLIKINFGDEEVQQVNFSKLVSQSKYIRDKYKYSDALDSLQSEIEEIKKKYNICEESIKLFLQLIQEEKVNIKIEQYKDIYTLSEYFCISKFTAILDKISKEELFNDLDFTIQTLIDYNMIKNGFETKLLNQIENFLSDRINECIKNNKFRELPVPTICRIVEQSNRKFDHNSLVDFIFESSSTHFILFKFVELQKLTEEKVDELIKFIEKQDETTRKMYSEYISLNLSFINSIKNKYNQLFNEFNQTKQEFNQTKQELNQTKQELSQTKQELNQTKQELNQTKQELNQTKQELNQTKQEPNQIKQVSKHEKTNFNGIFAALKNSVNGQNPALAGIVDITASSGYHENPYILLEYNENVWFGTKNISNSYIRIDFKTRKVSLTGYSLKTHSISGNGHITGWILSGSNDSQNWTIIDEMPITDHFDSLGAENYYQLNNKTPFYQYYELKQTRPNSMGCYNLRLSSIEFFGSFNQ